MKTRILTITFTMIGLAGVSQLLAQKIQGQVRQQATKLLEAKPAQSQATKR